MREVVEGGGECHYILSHRVVERKVCLNVKLQALHCQEVLPNCDHQHHLHSGPLSWHIGHSQTILHCSFWSFHSHFLVHPNHPFLGVGEVEEVEEPRPEVFHREDRAEADHL